MAPSKPASTSAKQRKASGSSADAQRSPGTAVPSARAAESTPTSAGRGPPDALPEAGGRRPQTFMSWSKIQLYRLHVTLGGPILTTGESVMLYVVLVGGLALVGLGAYKQLLRLAELAADRLGGGGAAAAGQGK